MGAKYPNTMEGKLSDMLYNCGLFENQVAGVMAQVKETVGEPMQKRWAESADNYPPRCLPYCG